MPAKLVLVNAEPYWAEYLTDYELFSVRLQTSQWLWRDQQLWVFDTTIGKGVRADYLFWRIGAVRPFLHHREALDLIRLAQLPCINSAQTMLRCFDRLAMLNELRDIGLPVIPFEVMTSSILMDQLPPRLPSVVKVGSYHAGYGKMLLTTLEQWHDLKDFLMITDDFFTVEPYIDYKSDIRCLGVGDRVWTMARNGSHWKANVGYVDTQMIAPPPVLYDFTRRAMQHFRADILALDVLETQTGEFIVLECNSVPGLAGFPDAVTEEVVSLVKTRFDPNPATAPKT